MHALAIALHLIGVSVWLGAGLTFMIFGPAAKRMSLESWANTWMTLARVQQVLVAPACAVATLTGILLTMELVQGHFDMGGATWLMAMQALGMVAAILTIVFATPLAGRMGTLARRSLEKGQMEPAAERVRKMLALVSSISGVLVLVSMYFGAAKP
jgi:putative copper export protein